MNDGSPPRAAAPQADDTGQAADGVLADLLAQRYSCRGFLPQSVPQATITRILELAQRTASWCNAQPWQVVITSGAATDRFRDAIYRHATSNPADADIPFPREYRGACLARRRECGFQLYDSVGIKRGDREASGRQGLENFRLFGAPHVAIITSDEALGVYGAVDCGAYVSNFMLAARSLGVATIAQAALASQSKFVRSHFGIGDDRLVVCGISFGYEDTAHPANGFRTRRASVAEAVTWVDS
ncbi:nitroreductase [Vineibacter terrae]|uniref:nitroreductase n=1 Tax=Vineibacter terrae TaxID=2586908 RepID=UPI002E314E69|nr:nitroreductase [Vineibacter terrae]HEX2887671.1 nitroreductase [Vineibacter terrae]